MTKLPNRPKSGHKGTFGTVGIAGGSITPQKVMIGSAVFAALAAIRSGAGMVVFMGSKDLLIQLIKLVPQATGVTSEAGLSEVAQKWQSLVVGPGLGMNKINIKLIEQLLSLKIPTVIDADGLNTLAEYPVLAESLHEFCVLTPHPKELERLLESFGAVDANDLASKLGCTVVAKSNRTYVTDGRNNWSNTAENPVLATGGTGDVLSGIIGGLMAQYSPEQLSVCECARLGVEIHTRAGKEWQKEHGSGGLIIEELLELVPSVMEKMR